MIIVLSLLVCIIGAVIYALSNNGKVMSLALNMFWVGLFVFLLRWSGTFTVIR